MNELLKSNIVVVGMHRSGTSALAGALHHAGYYAGQNLIQGYDNPKGHFEERELVAINDALLALNGSTWRNIRIEQFPPVPTNLKQRMMDFVAFHTQSEPWVMKDPRFCITLPVWKVFLPPGTFYVYNFRNSFDVEKSLNKRNGEGEWLSLIRLYERAANMCNEHIWYEELIENWRREFDRLCVEYTAEQEQDIEEFLYL